MFDGQAFLGSSLTDRTTSGYPLSIGTGLAFESLFAPRQPPHDPERKPPQMVDVTKYQEIWINLFSLFRNIAGAVSREVFLSASEHDLKEVLNQEIEVINSLFSNEGQSLCKPIYYFCTYDKLTKTANQAVKFRTDNTDFQKFFRFKLMRCMELIFKETDEHYKLDSSIKPKVRFNSLIMTHVPYDLLSYKHFGGLTLLESHTGKLKTRREWNTKYFPVIDNDMSNLPFERKLLLIFGDRVLIQPGEMKLRRKIVDIANSCNWTAMTTLEKIMLDFQIHINEPYVLKFLQDL